MEIQIDLFNQNMNCYTSNIISDIILTHQDHKYKISVDELLEYLDSKSKNMSSIDKDFSKKDIIYNILIQKDDMIDEFTRMKDEELIYIANILLKDAKKAKINDFYKNKNIPYRPFNLVGLVANNKIDCESKRKTIRELCRKCYDFLYSNHKSKDLQFVSESKINCEENEISKTDEKNIINQSELYSKTCIYKFKRGNRKGQICGNISLQDESYCKICVLMKPKVNRLNCSISDSSHVNSIHLIQK